jgi:quinol-cytochrome oxidoreductase complex cytochrome b subunit
MKFVAFLLSIVLLACVAGSTAYSQSASTPTMLKQVPPSIGGNDTGNPPQDSTTPVPSMDQQKLQADFQLKLTSLVTAFGIFGLIFVAWVFRSAVTTDTEKIVRLVIVVIVVCASLILIAGGYSTNQTAPAFGLFGSIIGYILGSANRQTAGNTPADGGTAVTGNMPPTGNTIAPTGNKT